jgi:hypothetical protein
MRVPLPAANITAFINDEDSGKAQTETIIFA